MKRFLYLFQVEHDLPASLEAAAGPDSDIRFLSWGARSADPRSLHYPSSSWTQGRNRLLRAVQHLPYRYFVFADDDVDLTVTPLGAGATGSRDPWRVFEDFLLKWEPAVGCTAHGWHLTGGAFDPREECQTLRFFDALLNAFHAETLQTLLPYYDLLDEQSECYSQNLLCSLAADLYPGHVIQTNHVRVANTQARREYSELLLSKPEHLYLESVTDPGAARAFLRQTLTRAARHPTMGPPQRKQESYVIDEAALGHRHNLAHVFWARRRRLRDLPETDAFFSDDPHSDRAQRWARMRKPRVVPAPPSRGRRWAEALRIMPALRSSPGLRRVRERLRTLHHGAWAGASVEVERVAPQLAQGLRNLPDDELVFVNIGAHHGLGLARLPRALRLRTPVCTIGIDAVDADHREYTGYVLDPPSPIDLATILRQYGLADRTLHLVQLPAPRHETELADRLGSLAARCLFVRLVGCAPDRAGSDVAIGATTFTPLQTAAAGSDGLVDVTFVNREWRRC